MSSSIRLTSSGAPDTPPFGYARIFLDDYKGRLHLKMIRPDGSIEVFGTLNLPLEIENGGTGIQDIPAVGQFLIGTGNGYRVGDIIAGSGINIIKTADSFEISTDISNIELQMPPEFNVSESTVVGENAFVVTKAEQLANTIYAGPSISDGMPSFRYLQIDDIPELPITKIINLIETIRTESLLIPTNTDDISHSYDSTTKILSSSINATNVSSGTYGSASQIPSITIKPDGRIDTASDVLIAISHNQITDFSEATQNVVGSLIVNSDSINAEYNDYENNLKLHINEEHIITTNISETENRRAPTSQSIKQYVDELVDAERNSRITEDTALNQKLNTFFNNAPEVLDTIVEISDKFQSIEASISENTQTITNEINRVYNAITAHRETITLTPELLTQSIPLAEVTQVSHIMNNSVVAFADRIGLFEGLDFTLSNDDGRVVLNLTPSVLSLIDGTEIIRISYLTKI